MAEVALMQISTDCSSFSLVWRGAEIWKFVLWDPDMLVTTNKFQRQISKKNCNLYRGSGQPEYIILEKPKSNIKLYRGWNYEPRPDNAQLTRSLWAAGKTHKFEPGVQIYGMVVSEVWWFLSTGTYCTLCPSKLDQNSTLCNVENEFIFYIYTSLQSQWYA